MQVTFGSLITIVWILKNNFEIAYCSEADNNNSLFVGRSIVIL